MENVLVWVTFEVEYHPLSASTDRAPRLFGSLKELGVWKHRRSIRARKTEDDFIWKIRMKVPAKSYFFFNWIVKDDDGKFTVEETGCRKADVGKFGGTFHTIYGNAQFTFMSNCGCHVELTTSYILKFTEEIGVVGSGDSLGNWREENIVKAVKNAPDYWVVNLEVAQFFLLEYKWVIVDKISKRIVRWQEGGNRKIRIGNGWKQLKLDSPWLGDVRIIFLDKTLNTSIDAVLTADRIVKILPPTWKSSGVVFPIGVVSPSVSMTRVSSPHTSGAEIVPPSVSMTRVTSPHTSGAEIVPPSIQDRKYIKRTPAVLKKFSDSLYSNLKRMRDREMWFKMFILMNRIYNQWRFNQ